MNKQTRIYYFDFLRSIAILMVVIIHLTAPCLSQDHLMFGWESNFFYNSISRLGVPLFFMISGALFLNPISAIDFSYIRRKIVRIIIAFIIFSLLYNAVWYVTAFRGEHTLTSVLSNLLSGWFHLWFLQALFTLYVLTPIIRKVTENTNLTNYLILILFLVCSVFPFVGRLFDYEDYTGNFFKNLGMNLPQWLLYYVLGYRLYTLDVDNKKRICKYSVVSCMGGVFSLF